MSSPGTGPIRTSALVSVGTQVVVNADIRGSNQGMVHPRGAVGIITRTPAGTETHYLVRFPDGFEASFQSEQFEILKHFKDRFDSPSEETAFDLEDCVIFRCITGSRAYGLETDDSDTDLRGVYLAPADMTWSLYGAPEQFEDIAGQSCVWELQKFLVLALKANPNVLECLYSPLVEKVTPLGSELLAIRGHFLSKMVFQTFNGYALSQFRKIEQDLRNQGEVRWKHAMHLLRLLLSGAAILREGEVPVWVQAHREQLLAVKRGDVSWDDVSAWRKSLHHDFEAALVETKLPERPNYEAVNLFLIRSRQKAAQLPVAGQ
ncbi:DNA polymerase beta superfamily protein [Nibricoccus sp. IMCC34717]|uniref:DNA polymerase beta superfamily protein n=1 Tax=Nibricoccus sp. IMCC34717 TaxID=3034021 RepID=UPI00384BACA3